MGLEVRGLWLLLFYFLVGFLVLIIMVRIAPFVVVPRLYVGNVISTTTLDLSEVPALLSRKTKSVESVGPLTVGAAY
jgi:hypothetical protein